MSKNQQCLTKMKRNQTYEVISYEQRLNLIELVIEHKISIYKASQLLKINNATAKVIIRKYRQNGYIFKKKSEQTSKTQEHSQDSMDHKFKMQKSKENISEFKQTSKQDQLQLQDLKIDSPPILWYYQLWYGF